MSDLTSEQLRALECARHLAENGVPIFLAQPDRNKHGDWVEDGGHHHTGYWLPKAWQFTKPDPTVVDDWRPGMALCAVTGLTVDLFDVDPRSGGVESLQALQEQDAVPRSYGRQATPSGGTHDFIAALHVRSLDKVLPGIDVKSGTPDGKGRGFAFLAPTVKLSKATGALIPYRWDVRPDLTPMLISDDDSGYQLAFQISERHAPQSTPREAYDGPAFEEMSETERGWAQAYVEAEMERWSELLQEAQEWPDGQTDDKGRGWENLTRDFAWALARQVVTPWSPLDAEKAEELFHTLLPTPMAKNKSCAGKWYDGLIEKAAETPVGPPSWRDFVDLEIDEDAATLPDIPPNLEDGLLVLWVAGKGLENRWAWSGGRGWLEWDGRRWAERNVNSVTEAVRSVFQEVNNRLIQIPKMALKKRQAYIKLLEARKIRAVVGLLAGAVEVSDESFDRYRDLLNVRNGIVDLRTGALMPHDRKYFMTRITQTNYDPDAQHPDWDQVLTCLDPDVMEWLQVRIGNAATGYPSSDHIIPLCQGGGSNGKTTFLNALFVALGDHMTKVPDKLLNASPGDHPTEMTELLGARMAVIDETPEEGKLNPQRLKAIAGQDQMKARRLYKDNITWTASHSLFVMTNHLPYFSASDEGTWRRLMLVEFDRVFDRDDNFALRVADGSGGRREATLAWIVAGAMRWYELDKQMPPAPEGVQKRTEAWRAEIDALVGYFSDRIVFDPDACVLVREIWEDMNEWLLNRGSTKWSERLFGTRLGGHKLYREHKLDRRQVRKAPDNVSRLFGASGDTTNRPYVLFGVRFRTEEDA